MKPGQTLSATKDDIWSTPMKVGRFCILRIMPPSPEGYVVRFWDAAGRQVHDGYYPTAATAAKIAQFLEAACQLADAYPNVQAMWFRTGSEPQEKEGA